MPRYDFKCQQCGKIFEDVILPIKHTDGDRPVCCEKIAGVHITVPPMVHWVDPVIEPYRSIADKDRTVITTTRQRREYMKKHDLIDANDFGPPPNKAQQMEYHRDVVLPSIAATTPTEEQARELKQAGIISPVDDHYGATT